MKLNSLTRIGAMLAGLLLFANATTPAQEGAKGGGTKLLQLSGPPAVKKTEVVSAPSMQCGKCKEEFGNRVDLTARGANKPTVFVAKHLCAGCGTDWKTVGVGKTMVSVAIHKCTSCGEASATCCDTGKMTAKRVTEKPLEIAPLK